MKLDNLLIVRTDKLGDTLLSLPAIQLARKYFQQTKIDFLCQDIYQPILKEYLSHLDVSHLKMGEEINWKKYQAVIFLWENSGLLFKAWLNKVPYRVGLYSKWSSFLFLNTAIRQKRSHAEKSEAEYNLDFVHLLAKKLSLKKIENLEPITLSTSSSLSLERPYVVIHPGQAGSALNISAKLYGEILDYLENKNLTVYFTKGSHFIDQKYIDSIQKTHPKIKVLENLHLDTLLSIYKNSKLVIAPSTGPLHLAHYSGTRTLGFYPPIRHQSAKRWAPYGGSGKSFVLTPTCPTTPCPHEDCMDNMSWKDELEKALE